MKVVQQLIVYLARRGLLSAADAAYLQKHGFLPHELTTEAGDVLELSDGIPDEDSGEFAAGPEEYWEQVEVEAAAPAGAGRRRRGRTRRKGPVMTAREIGARLAGTIPDWAETLQALVTVARGFEAGAGLKEAPEILHRAGPRQLETALAAALAARRPSLRELWAALSLEAYHQVVELPGLHGPAVRAYQAVLAAEEHCHVGSRAWVLRQKEIAWVFMLTRAQRRLLAACGRLYREDPELISRELSRERQEGAFWAFSLLYNAHRFVPGTPLQRIPRPASDRVVDRAQPDREAWFQAWSQAWVMDPRAVAPFLAHYLSAGWLILASGSYDGTVRLWHAPTGETRAILDAAAGPVLSVALSPDGGTTAAGYQNGQVRLWDTRTGAMTLLNGHSDSVDTVAFSPEGRTLASAGADWTIRLWDVKAADEQAVLRAHADRVNSVAFSPDARLLASGSDDRTLRLWEVTTGRMDAALQGHEEPVTSVAFSLDGRLLASGSADHQVKLWDVERRELKRTLEGYLSGVRSVTFLPDGVTLASGAVSGMIRLCNVATWRLRTLQAVLSEGLTALTFSADGALLAGGSADRAVRLWDPETGEQRALFRGHSAGVTCLASPAERFELVCPSSWQKFYRHEESPIT
jgi:WD40 repeat protein